MTKIKWALLIGSFVGSFFVLQQTDVAKATEKASCQVERHTASDGNKFLSFVKSVPGKVLPRQILQLFGQDVDVDKVPNKKVNKRFFRAVLANDTKSLEFILNNAQFKPSQKSATQEVLNFRNPHNNTALHEAARLGHMGALKVLIKHADDKAEYAALKGAHQMLPLHLAALQGNVKATKYLWDHMSGKSPATQDKYGWHVLHHAVRGEHLPVVRLLLDGERGRVPSSEAVVTKTSLMKRLITQPDKYGKLPLHWAAASGKIKILQRLANQDTLYNKDEGGRLPLHYAVWGTHMGAVDFLLQADPRTRSIESTHNWLDNDDNTPLHWAVKRQSAALVDRLLLRIKYHRGSNIVNVRTEKTGQTALHMAIEQNNSAIVKRLLNAGAETSRPNKNGFTPFYLAAYYGQLNNLKLMHPASYKHHNSNEPTAISEKFLDEHKDTQGKTPLDAAASNGYSKVVNWLLKQGREG